MATIYADTYGIPGTGRSALRRQQARYSAEPTPQADPWSSAYSEFHRTAIGPGRADLSNPDTLTNLHTAASRYADSVAGRRGGAPATPGQPSDTTLARGENVRTAAAASGMRYLSPGRQVRETMSAMRVAETAPARATAVATQEKLVANQQARDASMRAQLEAERASGATPVGGAASGTSTDAIRLPQTQEQYQREQQERRFPLGPNPASGARDTAIQSLTQADAQHGTALASLEPQIAAARAAGDTGKVAQLETEQTRIRDARGQNLARLNLLKTQGEPLRPSQTATTQAYDYSRKTLPLINRQREIGRNIDALQREFASSTDDARKTEIRQQLNPMLKAYANLEGQINAGPQAPSATALGGEQAETQRTIAGRQPIYAERERIAAQAVREDIARREAAQVQPAASTAIPTRPDRTTPETPKQRAFAVFMADPENAPQWAKTMLGLDRMTRAETVTLNAAMKVLNYVPVPTPAGGRPGGPDAVQIEQARNLLADLAKRYPEMQSLADRYKPPAPPAAQVPTDVVPPTIPGGAPAGTLTMNGTPAPGGAVPAPVGQEATLPTDPLEGRTATGPNGQKVIRKNGQWVPAQ